MRRALELLVIPLAIFLLLVAVPSVGAEEPAPPTPEETARNESDAREHAAAGRHAKAAASWRKVLTARPDDPWVKLSLAQALRVVGTPESLRLAEKSLVALVELDWQHPTRGNVRYEVDHALAAVLWRRAEGVKGKERAGLLARSITAWERLLAVQPRYPAALVGLARANLAMERDEAGFDYAERYLALCRDSRLRWEQQLAMWQARLGQAATPEQISLFAKRIEGARQKEEEATLLIAGAHMRRKEPKKALSRYDALIDPGPASGAVYLARAEAYAALDQPGKAVADLERCLELSSKDSDAELRRRATSLLERWRKAAGKAAPPR